MKEVVVEVIIFCHLHHWHQRFKTRVALPLARRRKRVSRYMIYGGMWWRLVASIRDFVYTQPPGERSLSSRRHIETTDGSTGSPTAARTFIWSPDESIPSGAYLVKACMQDCLICSPPCVCACIPDEAIYYMLHITQNRSHSKTPFFFLDFLAVWNIL